MSEKHETACVCDVTYTVRCQTHGCRPWCAITVPHNGVCMTAASLAANNYVPTAPPNATAAQYSLDATARIEYAMAQASPHETLRELAEVTAEVTAERDMLLAEAAPLRAPERHDLQRAQRMLTVLRSGEDLLLKLDAVEAERDALKWRVAELERERDSFAKKLRGALTYDQFSGL